MMLSEYIVYLIIFRLGMILAGITCIVLGYRLFKIGVWGCADNDGTEIAAQYKDTNFTVKNAAPGTCFALFGVIILSVMLMTGSPALTMNAQQGIATNIIQENNPEGISLTMRGDKTSPALNNKDIQKDRKTMIVRYEKTLEQMAAPMNDLAWLYMKEGQLENALPLVKIANLLSPNKVEFLDTRAEILFQLGRREDAVQSLEKATAIEPDNAEIRVKLNKYKHFNSTGTPEK